MAFRRIVGRLQPIGIDEVMTASNRSLGRAGEALASPAAQLIAVDSTHAAVRRIAAALLSLHLSLSVLRRRMTSPSIFSVQLPV